MILKTVTVYLLDVNVEPVRFVTEAPTVHLADDQLDTRLHESGWWAITEDLRHSAPAQPGYRSDRVTMYPAEEVTKVIVRLAGTDESEATT